MEEILLVDIDDRPVGHASKEETHRRGLLHRAFSVFILSNGRMLLQRRSPEKYHSGGLWSNACCSHQRKGERLDEAVHRRMREELSFDCPLAERFRFIYRTSFSNGLIEYELDHVFLGSYDGDIVLDPGEASEYAWVELTELKDRLMRCPEQFSSWFLIAVPRLLWDQEQAP